jgi:hypothetical protein
VSGQLLGPTPDQHLSWSQTQKNMLPHVASSIASLSHTFSHPSVPGYPTQAPGMVGWW